MELDHTNPQYVRFARVRLRTMQLIHIAMDHAIDDSELSAPTIIAMLQNVLTMALHAPEDLEAEIARAQYQLEEWMQMARDQDQREAGQ